MDFFFLYSILQLHSSALSVFITTCIKHFAHHFDDFEVHSSMLFWREVAILSIKKNVDSAHIYVYSLSYLVSTFSNLLTFNQRYQNFFPGPCYLVKLQVFTLQIALGNTFLLQEFLSISIFMCHQWKHQEILLSHYTYKQISVLRLLPFLSQCSTL